MVIQVTEKFTSQIIDSRSEITNLAKDTSEFVNELRQAASDRLSTLTFPTTRDEDWKYTDVSSLKSLVFANQSASSIDLETLDVETLIDKHSAPESSGNLIVFVNGEYSEKHSNITGAAQGLVIGTLANLGDRILPKLRSHLAQHPDANDYFTSINTACMAAVAIILVPKDMVVKNPVQLIFVSQSKEGALLTQPRCLVIAESHSSLTFVQTFVGSDDQTYFTNAVTEVWLADGAQVNQTEVQWQGNAAVHINTTAIAQAKNSVYKNQSISLGAKLSRQNLIVQQMAEQTETSLTGLAFIDGEQLADTHSAIAHNYPHGSSKQLHKCIADGRSHTVFNGKIQVAKLAQHTDSAQLSRNLLLSAKARVDTKPQLEIFADNVKCAHGATVSQLDAEEIFYLQSRAIDAESAANLLTYAFATEAIAQIPIESVRRSLSNFVLEKTKAQ